MTSTSRREFLKLATIAGVNIYFSTLSSKVFSSTLSENHFSAVAEYGKTPNADQYRIDGIAKVTGAKVFARDVRAKDLEGWPSQQAYGFILRINQADRAYLGMDLSTVSDDMKPIRIITARDLAKDKIDFPAFYGKDMLLPEGKVAPLLGQPVAILIFDQYEKFRQCKKLLQFNETIFKYGPVVGPLKKDPWASFRSVRIAGATPEANDIFSSLKNNRIQNKGYSNQEPLWPKGNIQGDASEQGMYYAQQIQDELANPSSEYLVIEREFKTQSTDAFTMETENANCWYDSSSKSLHMVVSVQNPNETMTSAVEMLKGSAFALKDLYIYPSYTVGYGSKDSSNHTFYVLLASLYAQGLPVRIALDRYENFQAALKRHPYDIRYKLAVNRNTGKFASLQAQIESNGGGRPSFSPYVLPQSTIQAGGIYYYPKSDLCGTVKSSRAMDASAIRGFGSLQTVGSMEMMVDEIATILGQDPIDFRLNNVMLTGMKTSQGAIPSGQNRAIEVLQQAKKQVIWQERYARKASFEKANPGKSYGVGFGCAQKSFGTGREAAFAKIEISPDGHICVFHPGIEMGTGLATTQAVICEQWLGQAAHEVKLGITDWADLPMESMGNANTNQQSQEDDWSRTNPRWTPNYVSSSGATNTAYYLTHATKEAGYMIFRFGLWPAALAIWGQGINGGQLSTTQPKLEQARWVSGCLTATGLEPLSLNRLAHKAHELGLVTGSVVHTFNRWQWAEAEFKVAGNTFWRPIDGLSLRYGNAKNPHAYHFIKRNRVQYPAVDRVRGAMTLFCVIGSLVELSVDKKSGAVEVLNHHSIVECGNVMIPQLVSGQMSGAMAMGIGHALMEYLPLYEDGPGKGNWNLDRYSIPRASDVAVWSQSHEMLPPLSDTDPPKGMAEVAIIPIVPAIANAVAFATGKRFYDLPITAEKMIGAPL